jgi:ornithine carbamoyltransferase
VLNQDKVTTLEANVDGVELKDLRKYRVQSPLFEATFPKNNLFGVSAGPTQAVADGFWILLHPLSPGKHDVHFKGAEVDFTSTGTNSFATDVTYHLTVK